MVKETPSRATKGLAPPVTALPREGSYRGLSELLRDQVPSRHNPVQWAWVPWGAGMGPDQRAELLAWSPRAQLARDSQHWLPGVADLQQTVTEESPSLIAWQVQATCLHLGGRTESCTRNLSDTQDCAGDCSSPKVLGHPPP